MNLLNVRVSKCGESGIAAHVGGIVVCAGVTKPIKGTWCRMSVFNNSTKGNVSHFGLDAGYSNGKIILIHPLQKWLVSEHNDGGRNYSGETIKSVALEDLE